jgi:hypothetical protein
LPSHDFADVASVLVTAPRRRAHDLARRPDLRPASPLEAGARSVGRTAPAPDPDVAHSGSRLHQQQDPEPGRVEHGDPGVSLGTYATVLPGPMGRAVAPGVRHRRAAQAASLPAASENPVRVFRSAPFVNGNTDDVAATPLSGPTSPVRWLLSKASLLAFTLLPTLDAVVLFHAHLDHSGALAVLAHHGYRGPLCDASDARSVRADARGRGQHPGTRCPPHRAADRTRSCAGAGLAALRSSPR